MAVPSRVRTVTDAAVGLGEDRLRVNVAVVVPDGGQITLIQLTDTVGVSGAGPVPVRDRLWAPSPSLAVIAQVSVRVPWVVGVKATVSVRDAPAGDGGARRRCWRWR